LLHAHSIDAAQQGFPKACKTARSCRKIGLNNRYPYKRKIFRTTIWKNTGIRKENKSLILALARGNEALVVRLPPNLSGLKAESFLEMRLVYNQPHKFYQWHAVVEDEQAPVSPTGLRIMGVDLGEIHPAAATDGETAVVFSARALRSLHQQTNRRVAFFQSALSRKKKGSRADKRLKTQKARFLAQQKRRRNDIEHKLSRAVVDYALERGCKEIAVGDVRNVADKTAKSKVANQKISNWSHGQLRKKITYKAEGKGMSVVLVSERYTSQTCPNPACQHKYKPKGRIYRCPACGFVGHRDVVGAAHILSRHRFGELARVPVVEPKYRFAYRVQRRNERSPVDTRQVACPQKQEATGI